MLKFQITNEIELRLFVKEDAEDIFNVVKANYEHRYGNLLDTGGRMEKSVISYQ